MSPLFVPWFSVHFSFQCWPAASRADVPSFELQVNAADLDNYAPNELLIVTTGSQVIDCNVSLDGWL